MGTQADKKFTFSDFQRALLLPLILGGGGLGAYGTSVLSARLDNEIERRHEIQETLQHKRKRIDDLTTRVTKLEEKCKYLARRLP